jgi:hypothetical protein
VVVARVAAAVAAADEEATTVVAGLALVGPGDEGVVVSVEVMEEARVLAVTVAKKAAGKAKGRREAAVREVAVERGVGMRVGVVMEPATELAELVALRAQM